jgi:hypothetical protein
MRIPETASGRNRLCQSLWIAPADWPRWVFRGPGGKLEPSWRWCKGISMSELEREIERRLRCLFQRLADGDDAPPGMRLRLEGLREAAVISGESSAARMQSMMGEVYREVSGQTLEKRLGADWAKYQPFPEIPALVARAPVSVTTRD